MNRQKNIAAVLIIALILFFGRGCSDETPDITVTHTQQITTATGEASGYVVKTYNGKIAVFHKSENVPMTVFEVRADSLPEVDREALESGIFAADDSELQRLIEDYTS